MELRKVKYFEQGSQETPCFTAELWDGGKLVAYLENSGHGGNNMVHPAKGLTYKDVAKYDDGDVECDIFGMVYEFDDIRKNQSKGFFIKKGEDYYVQKFPYPISKMKKQDWYPAWLIKQKASIIKDGFIILNKNL
jgi:hypothetical protein